MSDRLIWLKDQLVSNWSIIGDTVGSNIFIDLRYNHKSPRVQYGDYVLLYTITEGHEGLGIGGKEWNANATISVDIRTQIDRNRAYAIMEEVKRIVRDLQFSQNTMWQIKSIRATDFSDRNHKLWRWVIDISVEQEEYV